MRKTWAYHLALSLLTVVSVSVFSVQTFAQSTEVSLKADSTDILIGDFLHVELTVKSKGLSNIVWPAKNPMLGNMEIVSASAIDTQSANGIDLFKQDLVVSAYDSGEYTIGPVYVLYNSNGSIDTAYSNDVIISVATLDVDTTRAIMPIKAPLKVPMTWQELLPYIALGFLASLLIAAIVLIILTRKKKQQVTQQRERPKDPAHIWAKKELRQLEEEKLWQKDDVKGYYSRLTEILRLYLEYRYNMPALESTTDEIDVELVKYHVKHKAKDALMETLKLADLVKFAKMLPGPDRHMGSMQQAYTFIDLTAPREEEKPTDKK